MKKRIKDFAFALKVDKSILMEYADVLDSEESKLYHSFKLPKPDLNGVPQSRTIDAPGINLRTLQRKILKSVLYKLNLPEYFFGGLPGKDAVLNARHHQGNKFFFLTDMKSFYPSVSNTQVYNALIKEGFYPVVAKMITRLSTKKGSVPQGCPTSSFLAALVVRHKCDDLFEGYKNKGLKVSVYVDDITISGTKDFKEDVQNMISDMRARGLKINFNKTHYCTKNPKVTGILIKNNGIVPMPYTYDLSRDETISEASRNGHKQRIKYVKSIAKRKIIIDS